MNPTLAALTLVLFGTRPACSSETVDPDLQGVASVIDGDTIEIHGARIRLNGIDAPEKRPALPGRARHGLALWPAGGVGTVGPDRAAGGQLPADRHRPLRQDGGGLLCGP